MVYDIVMLMPELKVAYTIREAAEILGVSQGTIRNLLIQRWADGELKLRYAPRSSWPNGKCVLITANSIMVYGYRRNTRYAHSKKKGAPHHGNTEL